MKKRNLFLVVSLIMAMVLLSSCGGKEAVDEGSVVKEEVKDDYYPITIQNYDYNKKPIELTFNRAPEKVIAVYQNSIETLLALGLEDKIVLASGLDHDVKDEYKYQFESINYNKNIPSKEEVIGLESDFILSWYSIFDEKRLGDVKEWNSRGVNTYIAQNSGIADPNTLENEYEDILNVGKIFNVNEKAEQIVNEMKTRIEETSKKVEGKEKVRAVIFEVSEDGVFRIYGENSIGGNIATSVGADLVAKENGNIGAEDLIKLNPDVIFTVYYGDSIAKDEALSRLENPALASISAIKNNRVYPMMLSEVYASGVRTLDGINTIINGLYPETK